MKRLFYFIIILGAMLAGVNTNAAEQYTLIDSDSSALITHPLSEPSYLYLLERGPIGELLSLGESFATDSTGNKWGGYVIEQRVYVITSDGKFFWVAGTGAAGFRDGPAHRAMFNMGGNGYDYGDIDADSRGNAYVADTSNNRIRKISKQDDGTWIVSTLAGGGTRRLNPGETALATEAQTPAPLAVAVDSFDNVWFFDYRALYKVADGQITAYSRVPDQRAEYVNVVDMEADDLGNIYAITRANSASMLWKITQDGKIHWAAGISQAEWTAYVNSARRVPVDGPADNASFFATGSISVEPDGSAVYVGGGDELGLRRFKDGRVSQLTTGGWIESQSRSVGFEVGAIAGIDSLGRIYGVKAIWRPPDQNQWTALRMLVPSDISLPTLTFTASPFPVASNMASTLSWSSANVDSCTASGAWSGSKPLSGSESTGALTAAKTYTLTCTGTGGTSSKSVTVTVAPAPDTTPPTVSITSPSAGQTVSGTITIQAAATDNTGVAGVQFKVDGVNTGAEDTTAPYSIIWGTATASNGVHTLTAVARDAAGNTATSLAASVTVNNLDATPPVISAVAAASITSTGATITWSTSELATHQVEYGLTISYGSQTAENANLMASHSQLLGGLTPNTLYHYRVKSRDASGNLAVSGDFTFTTSNIIISSLSENFIRITEKAGVTTANYPIQVGRPFMQGEIQNFPQAVVDSVPVLTQADVKQRWPDGSVKHAVLTFLIPTLRANSAVAVTFKNQATGNNDNPETKSGMLSPRYDFDAAMELTNETTLYASARTMLEAGAFEYWLRGQVATSIILADHSAARTFDIGFDQYRSFRPIFHATFWPGINKVRVRFIGEIANSEVLQNQRYNLTLKLGQSQSVMYNKSIHHYANSRWTKEFWIGGEPPAIAIDHNLAYLVQTKFISNYDTRITIPESAIENAYRVSYDSWLKMPRDLYDSGKLVKAMGNAGARDDIGPYPTWTVRWLYTGDPRSEEEALGNADLSAAYPVHFREGNQTKYLDRERTIPGIGRIISISTRPVSIGNLKYVGMNWNGGWAPDTAHQADFVSPQYTLTGDYWYLEEMMFWASWSTMFYSPAGSTVGRGPTGAEGGIPSIMGAAIRGQGWAFRNRAQTAFLVPDDMPEKAYFTTLMDDAIAIWEGQRNIAGTRFYNNTNWRWGNTVIGPAVSQGLGVPLLNQWERGNWGVSPGDSIIDSTVSYGVGPTWEQNVVMYSLGRAQELGYPTGTLVSYLAKNIIGQITEPDYDPYLIGSYRMPMIRRSDRGYFPTWAELKKGYNATFDAKANFMRILNDANHGYSYIALAATAMAANEPGGDKAWQWIEQNALLPKLNSTLARNPKWAILPRNVSSVIVPLLTFTASPSSVLAGGSSILLWSSANVDSCTASGAWSGSKPTSGSESTGALASTKAYTLTCTGAEGSAARTVTVTVGADIASIISNVVARTSPTTATITFTTNEMAKHQVEYGLTFSYGSQTAETLIPTTDHFEAIGSLNPGTLYHFRIKAKDATGNLAVSQDFTFTTPNITTGSVNSGDINGDKTVNILDVVLIANYFGKTTFDSRADAAPPFGIIDIFDVMVVVINWGKQY